MRAAVGRASARHLPGRVGGLKSALRLCALLLAGPALAQTSQAPCLAARPDLAGHVAAFEAAGWAVAEGADRAAALIPPAEVYFRITTFPHPEATPAELEARLASVADWAEERLAHVTVLSRGEAGAMVALTPMGDGRSRLLCVVAAPDLPEVDSFLGAAVEPTPFGGLELRAFFEPAPLGLSDFRLDALRLPRPEGGAKPEALVVTATLEPAP